MLTPPHDLAAEQAVLGALLFDNQLLDAMPLLVGDCFYEPVHQRIFSATVRLIRAGRIADAVTLRAMAARDGALEEIGGAQYLLRLLEGAARLRTQAIDYAHLLIDLRARREIAVALNEAVGMLSQTSAISASDLLSGLEASLRKIAVSGESSGVTLEEAAQNLIANMSDPARRGMRTSFDVLNRRLGGFFPGELILIAGRPSMGKTALATNIARNLAAEGKRGHFASYEMSAESIAARSLSAASFADEQRRFDYASLRRSFEGPSVDVSMLRAMARDLPTSLLIDSTAAQTVAQLDASIRNTRRRLGGIDYVVVDYLQLMRSPVRGGRVEQMTEVSQGLKALGMTYNVPVFALSQLSRSNESREDKRPQLHDLRESGSLEQDADVVLGVYREAYYLKRAQPMRANFKSESEFNLADIEWSDKLRAVERILEVSTLKQRNGDVGTDTLDFWAKYDVAADAVRR